MRLPILTKGGGPPPTVVVPDECDTTTPEGQRKKHVQVCVRIRPLLVANNKAQSSSSFFRPPGTSKHHATTGALFGTTGNNTPTASAGSRFRKPQVPRPSGIPTPANTSSNPSNNSTSTDHEDTNETTVDNNNNNNNTDEVYAWDVISDTTVCQSDGTERIQGRTHSYSLDRVYGPSVSTQQVYNESCKDLVHAAMDGYHASILAYGQTSTGKTHTMSGTALQPGLIPLAIQECFQYLNSPAAEAREYLLRISYLEVYKEHIRDLLATSTATAPPVRLFDSRTDGLIIKGLREVVVTSPRQVFALLQQGEARRQVGATHMNQHSSRSHVMVRLWIESRAITGGGSSSLSGAQSNSTHMSSNGSLSSQSSSQHVGGGGGGPVRMSSLSLVDLAGSESVRLTGSNERREEGHYINKSLMTLGQVVYALSEMNDNHESSNGKSSKKPHIPFRDSKLTRLLQPSLSGNAQVVLLCCISPLMNHMEESHNTFKFATRAKKIPQKATIQEGENEKSLLQSYREEIKDLQRQLKEMREQQEQYMKHHTSSSPTGRTIAEPSLVSTSASTTSSAGDSVSEGEIQELVEAIETMEKLILKTSAASPPVRPEDLLDLSEGFDMGDEEKNLLALAHVSETTSTLTSTPAPSRASSMVMEDAATSLTTTPAAASSEAFHGELERIKGLLGSVLQKRINSGSVERLDDQVVRSLRAQLEQQEVASSLRKADSSFLQAQLEEKDKLLREVSRLLETVEVRQAKLEAENQALRKENALLKQYSRI